MMERWRSIPGYEGRYEVSDQGRARSLTVKGRQRANPLVIRDYPFGKGYRAFQLFDGETYRTVYVHRAVLLAFAGRPDDGMQGAHLDGVRTNNVLSNLIWATVRENHAHKIAHGTTLRGERGSSVKLSADQVRECRRRYIRGDQIHGSAALAHQFGVSKGLINDIVARRRWAYLDEAA